MWDSGGLRNRLERRDLIEGCLLRPLDVLLGVYSESSIWLVWILSAAGEEWFEIWQTGCDDADRLHHRNAHQHSPVVVAVSIRRLVLIAVTQLGDDSNHDSGVKDQYVG